MQILEAIKFIHKNNFYHGNINPDNILENKNENKAYLLDFGRSYLYAILKSSQNQIFQAPEQEDGEILPQSDIFSFGLCMLKLICDKFGFDFKEHYKGCENLHEIYNSLQDNIDEISAEILIIIRQMTFFEPMQRLNLEEVGTKLNQILDRHKYSYTFCIKFHNNELEKLKDELNLDPCYATDELEEKFRNNNSYWVFETDKEKRKEIKIAIGERIFCCSDNDDESYLFCFSSFKGDKILDEVEAKGLKRDDNFVFCAHNEKKYHDDAREIKSKIKELYELQELGNRRLANQKSVRKEVELLEAERDTLDEKKHSQIFTINKINKGKDTIYFKLHKDSNSDKFFKPKHGVIVKSRNGSFEMSGEVVKYDQEKEILEVEFKKYRLNIEIDDNEVYDIRYDHQIEDIILNKREKALEMLKNNTQIQNLFFKFGDPRYFIKNERFEINEYFNENLDENQKEAVCKAMSVDTNCEVLLIQGPPGTGKTTIIVETIKQFLKKNKNSKILITSQSNQAVDNVLERVCDYQNNLLRIGKDEKISKKAQNFTEKRVINTIIKDNLARIEANKIKKNHEHYEIYKELQDEFKESLQHITSKLKDKDKKYEEFANFFLSKTRVIFGTLIGISAWRDFREIKFDMAIVDEAGRATLSEIAVPVVKSKRVVLVGDHKQLAPVIDDEVLEKVEDKNIGISFFEEYFEKFQESNRPNLIHCLTYNYRSEKRICELYSRAFYDGQLIVSDEINETKKHDIRGIKSSVLWLDTSKMPNKEDRQVGTGKQNFCNLKIIQATLAQLNSDPNISSYDIGIISPYKDQVNLLNKSIKKGDLENLKFDIGTVDSFQGSDRDIIIYDCVRSSQRRGRVDFIADEKRLNVSLSRAKKLLIIVGDMEFLYSSNTQKGDNLFVEIIKTIRKNEDFQTLKETK